jgi:hypothetical protein
MYDEQIAEKLLDYIASGGSLSAACRAYDVPLGRVSMWALRNGDFRRRYFDAFSARMIVESDRILEIADEVAGSGSMSEVAAAKLRYDARRWLSGKLLGELADRTDGPAGTFSGATVNVYLPAKGSDGSGARVLDGEVHELLEDGTEDGGG